MTEPLRIAFLLFPEVTQLDLTGPAQPGWWGLPTLLAGAAMAFSSAAGEVNNAVGASRCRPALSHTSDPVHGLRCAPPVKV